VRTPRPKPNKLHDELDALLDGRPVELTDELAPLAEVAEALRAELAGYQLDPEVADRHLERVLDGAAPVVRLPVRPQPHGWELRRRVAAVVLAAALVLAPATMASAAALPGQAMYPFKLAIEELRIAAVQWSPGREALERTRVADTRTEEVQRLTELKIFNQLPPALTAMAKAVIQAKEAVEEAQQKGEPVAKVRAKLDEVVAAGLDASRQAVWVAVQAAGQQGVVPPSPNTLAAIQTAAVRSQQAILPESGGAPAGTTAPPTTIAAKPAQSTLSTTAATQPPGVDVSPTATPTIAVSTTTTAAPTTTTTEPPTTTSAPDSSVTTGSAAGGTGDDDDQAGLDGRSGDEATPTTTTAPPGP
jgi:Domain of unknown function (DUF5667)